MEAGVEAQGRDVGPEASAVAVGDGWEYGLGRGRRSKEKVQR